jgi:predicted transcriptional regulator of viral defense system
MHLYRGKSARRQRISGSDRVIAELAARQHGVVELRQLTDLGLAVQAVDKRVASGRLHRVHQGVYAVGHSLLSINGHRMAAVLACGPEAVLSHRSAAALWGIRRDGRNRIDVTAPGRRGRHPEGIDAHRHGSLRAPDIAEVERIPCTSVARTLLDMAAVVTMRELRNAVTQAEVQRIFDLGEVEELLGRSRGRRGVARMRLVIAEYDPREEMAREELERRFLALCKECGLPMPEVNPPLLLEGVPIEPDFLWRDARLIVETDGRRTHGTPTAFERDRRRDQHLKRTGWEVIRCTWRQVLDDPDDLRATVRTLLRRRPTGRWASNAPI